MPELPEVETTLRGISPYLLKKTIKQIQVRQASLRWPVTNELKTAKNLKVNSIARRGKYLLLETAQSRIKGHIIVHLGMSGSLRIVDKPFELRKHDHVLFELSGKKFMLYHDPRRFGSILWTTDPPLHHPLLRKLGPEPLSDDFNGAHLFKQSRKKKVAVKNFIMNSHIVVGVGNIYASETLFRAAIRPGKAAGRVSAAAYELLAENIKTVCEGEACRECGNKIKQITIGQRSTFYCTHCQH